MIASSQQQPIVADWALIETEKTAHSTNKSFTRLNGPIVAEWKTKEQNQRIPGDASGSGSGWTAPPVRDQEKLRKEVNEKLMCKNPGRREEAHGARIQLVTRRNVPASQPSEQRKFF
jgi:hypothetical protein